MSHHAPCALRMHRRIWGLSQQDLADILGFEAAAEISRLEHGKRTPRLETALACSTLFGVPPSELFPQLAFEIEENLRKRLARHREGSVQAITPHRDPQVRALSPSTRSVP